MNLEKSYLVLVHEIEQWPECNGAKSMPLECRQPVGQLHFFACHLCLKIRSADIFANAMMKGKRGKLDQGTVAEMSTRFCLPCGVKYGKYQVGTYLQYGGPLHGADSCAVGVENSRTLSLALRLR